ncbi:MAG: SUMF1/EgtB/PvdO family nonheme iron enzyme [Chitinophagales bacterium]|nr:SUMF1/EgtB/PvdO family nonheme iron enzyme [Chitinophagales bacterium]
MQQTINNKYQFDPQTDKLGSGGFGDVFRAKDIVLGRIVALKFFTRNLDSSRDVITEVSSFINNRLRHDNIIEYYDAFYYETTDRFGNPFKEQVAVLEYANGSTLMEQLPRLYADSEFRNMIINDVLQGLAYLGDENVVHRDMKPANIFLHTKPNGKLVAKIGDFGLMKLANSEQSTSRSFSTPEYTAPEQLNLDKYGYRTTPNSPPQIHPNCDLWAFGVMLYRFFTQELPFGSQTSSDVGAIIQRILSHQQRPLDYSHILQPYRAIVERCLVSNANERVKSADELLGMLQGNSSISPAKQSKFNNEKTIINPVRQQNPSESTTITTPDFEVMQSNEPPTITIKVANPIIHQLESNMVYVERGKLERLIEVGLFQRILGKTNQQIEVNLDSYYIGKYPVTQAEWQAVMGNNPSHFKGDNLPVEQVSWHDVQLFLQKLQQLTGNTYRLPTEAEWEYAARGGNKSQGYKYAGSNSLSSVAWYDDNSGSKTHTVGQKQANELGICDMSGNVWEWCSDWYDEDYYANSPANNPTGPTSGIYRVIRGGSWSSSAQYCRVAIRNDRTPGNRYDYLGFRLALP